MYSYRRNRRRVLNGGGVGCKTDRGEAQDHMEVLPDSGDEVVIEVVKGGWLFWQLLLHHRDEVLRDLIQFITGKQIRHLWYVIHNLTL